MSDNKTTSLPSIEKMQSLAKPCTDGELPIPPSGLDAELEKQWQLRRLDNESDTAKRLFAPDRSNCTREVIQAKEPHRNRTTFRHAHETQERGAKTT